MFGVSSEFLASFLINQLLPMAAIYNVEGSVVRHCCWLFVGWCS